jgi:hypothetical protein
MNKDLLLALLSMDSYNRGYSPGIKTFGPNNAGQAIGNAIIVDIPLPANSQPKGFYALAYDVSGAGVSGLSGTVISYRGTDFDLGDSAAEFFSSPFVADALSGWGVGVGLLGSQAGLAVQFYRSVIGAADPFAANVTLTGHSLGGGLAGFVGRLYSRDGVIYDNMTYELAVASAYTQATTGLTPDDVALRALIYGAGPTPLPGLIGPRALATTGEVLDTLVGRLSQIPAPINVDSNGGFRSPVTLHSMALLTNLIWARDNANANWVYAGKQLWDAYFSDDVAKGLAGIDAIAISAEKRTAALNSAIAYSALDAGERPFGDVAIRAMFNDAADFGTVLQNNFLPTWVSEGFKDSIGKVIVEFAGFLALSDAEDATTPGKLGGALSLNVPQGQSLPNALRISFEDSLWTVGVTVTVHITIKTAQSRPTKFLTLD